MAASLTYRNTNNKLNASSSSSASAFQDVSIPRRRPVDGSKRGGEGHLGLSSSMERGRTEIRRSGSVADRSSSQSHSLADGSLQRKRPRSEDTNRGRQHHERARERERVGESQYLINNNSSKVGDEKFKTKSKNLPENVHMAASASSKDRRRLSLSSNNTTSSHGDYSEIGSNQQTRKSSLDSKASRRSSMESVKSTTSTNSTSRGGGFRRLKKFKSKAVKRDSVVSPPSSPVKSSPVNSPSRTKRIVATTNQKDEDTASDTFQQTQLRLWKAAQERHQKLKEQQERKERKKRKKQQLREQLQRERLQKGKATGILSSDASESADLDESVSTRPKSGKEEERKESSSKGKRGTGRDESLYVTEREKEGKRVKKAGTDSKREARREKATSKTVSLQQDDPNIKVVTSSIKSKQNDDRDTTSGSSSKRRSESDSREGRTTGNFSADSSRATTENREDKYATQDYRRLDTSDADGVKVRKKLKKLKKLRRLAEAERVSSQLASDSIGTQAVIATSPPTVQSSANLEALDEMAEPVKKKKRRLVKMGSKDALGPQKKKVRVDEPSLNEDSETIGDKSTSKGQSRKVDDLVPPSTPDRKPTIATTSSFDSAPLTPLSFGLADTVKTRVRSCTKAKDELELLQAASFEKKKRKKLKQRGGESNSEIVAADRDSQVILKNKKKKKRKKVVLAALADVSNAYELYSHNNMNDAETNDTTYDADAEYPTEEGRGSKTKRDNRADGVAEGAPSEASSSSATVITGKLKKKKKKKRLRKFGSSEALFSPKENAEFEFQVPETRRKPDQPLPLKKRFAQAAAAAEFAWERNATSTTASKVSLSSGGTAPGASPEFGTEASSISEFTHPLEASTLPPPPPAMNSAFPKPSPVPREIVSKMAVLPPHAPSHSVSFDVGVDSHAMLGPAISSSDEYDSSSSDSDTDEEELYAHANAMFGTSAQPPPKEERASTSCVDPTVTPEMCEMERRRQKQDEARTLSVKEVNAILKEEQIKSSAAPVSEHWVRRSVRQPSRSLLNAPLTRKLLDKLRGNDADMVVLKMKKYLSDPDTPAMIIDVALDALEENSNCEALYIQNFNLGMKDKQVLHLLRILQMPTCNIWCLNIGETYNVTEETWEEFAEGLKRTKVTHMYASEHTITAELKDEIRDTIRWNRQKHGMHNDPNNLDVIVQCTHCWWNPINAKVLRPYLRKRGFESLLHDSEAQGLRGSISEAPGA